LQALIDEMLKTMYEAQGVGLAANQVGMLKKLIVMDLDQREGTHNPIVVINPRIEAAEGEIVEPESCLSVPDYSADIKRSEKVFLKGFDRHGKEISMECQGLLAKCVQHEVDHLNGICFVDRLGPVKKRLFKRKWTKSKGKNN
jgi:peptide deformylase